MKDAQVELWFDFSCPYAYLGFTQAPRLAAELGVRLSLEPMLLGGVFRARAVPQNLAGSLSSQKATHNAADLRRYAALFGVPLHMPSGHPLRTVSALRAMLAAGPPFDTLTEAFFRAYWVDGIDLSKPEGVAHVLSRAGHDAQVIMRRAESDEIKNELRVRTDRAIEKGVFGAPAFFVDGVLHWGQDRLDEVRLALGGVVDLPPPFAPARHAHTAPTDLYFDFASPFAYLAVVRARVLFGPALRLRPISLSTVLAEVNGRPERPFMNDAKAAFLRADIQRQAARHGLPLCAEPFGPVDTEAALSMTLAIERVHGWAAAEAFALAVFRARHERGEDIEDTEVLVGLARALGVSTEVQSGELSAATREALALGVFGVPSFVLRPTARAPSLYFGHDRLSLALLAARGDSRLY